MLLAVLLSVLLTAFPVLSKPFASLGRENALINNYERLSTPLLEIFQVFPPPLSPNDLLGSTVCSFTLMNHVFGKSAGKPFVGMVANSVKIFVTKSNM